MPGFGIAFSVIIPFSGPKAETLMIRRMEPEFGLLVVVLLFSIVARTFLPKASVRSIDLEGRIRVCVSCTPGSVDVYELVTRYMATSCKRYEVLFGIMIECTRMEDALTKVKDCVSEYKDRVNVHYTISISAENHKKRLRKMLKKFSNEMEDLVVLADSRVTPEYGWDENLMLALKDQPTRTVTCPLSPHPAGFPTLRERSNGDVVRDEAKPFLNDGVAFVPSVCVCHEFVAFSPNNFFLDKTSEIVVPTFSIIRPVNSRVEEDILDANMQKQTDKLTNSEKLGITQNPSGSELYHKYGSATAAKLAIKLDRRESTKSRGE